MNTMRRKYTKAELRTLKAMAAEGNSFAKIARELGRTPAAVKTQLYLASRAKNKTTKPFISVPVAVPTVETELVAAIVASDMTRTHKLTLLSRFV